MMTSEVQYNIKKVAKSSDSHFRAYADDSLKMIERPIFNTDVNIARTNNYELNGYFTSACVHGGMLREDFEASGVKFTSIFGWANSNPIGCTFSDDGEVDIMIYRYLTQSDYKGVNDRIPEDHVVSTSFQFYADNSVQNAFFHKVRANAVINEPYAIFPKTVHIEDIEKMGDVKRQSVL